MAKHFFNTEVAKECGINAAIIFENISFWVAHNEKQGKNERDGKYWMYQTQKELSEQFDYLSVKQVRTALEKLENAGYIIKANYNRHAYDRTGWYTITDKAKETFAPVEEEVKPQPQQEAPLAPQEAQETPQATITAAPAETPAQARKNAPARNGKTKRPYGQKQKPRKANPEPIWLHAKAPQGVPIQDLKEKSKKEILIQRMRTLAAECGAVCTV